MTLFEYLNTIPTDPRQPPGPTNNPLKVFQQDPKPGQVGLEPWAFVAEAPGNVFHAFFGTSDLMSRLITVTLYQSPTAEGNTPNRAQMGAIWHAVADAVKFVDEDVGSNQFVALHRQTEQAPTFDPQTKGLFAAVRFRMLYFRG